MSFLKDIELNKDDKFKRRYNNYFKLGLDCSDFGNHILVYELCSLEIALSKAVNPKDKKEMFIKIRDIKNKLIRRGAKWMWVNILM